MLRLAAALCLGLFAASSASAQSYVLSYAGMDTTFGGSTGSQGSGSFSLDTTADGTYDASALTGFSFNLSTFVVGAGTDQFSYGLNDLENFSVTIANGQVTALSLMTDVQPATYGWDEWVWVTDLLPGDANTGNIDIEVSAGTMTVADAAVPEPASLALLAAGIGGAAMLRRRRHSA